MRNALLARRRRASPGTDRSATQRAGGAGCKLSGNLDAPPDFPAKAQGSYDRRCLCEQVVNTCVGCMPDSRGFRSAVATVRGIAQSSDDWQSLARRCLAARSKGLSWQRIGELLGTSPQAAQQRHGHILEAASLRRDCRAPQRTQRAAIVPILRSGEQLTS